MNFFSFCFMLFLFLFYLDIQKLLIILEIINLLEKILYTFIYLIIKLWNVRFKFFLYYFISNIIYIINTYRIVNKKNFYKIFGDIIIIMISNYEKSSACVSKNHYINAWIAGLDLYIYYLFIYWINLLSLTI